MCSTIQHFYEDHSGAIVLLEVQITCVSSLPLNIIVFNVFTVTCITLIHLERAPPPQATHRKQPLDPSPPLLDHPWKKMSGYAHVYYYSFCVYLHYTYQVVLSYSVTQLIHKKMPESCTYYIFLLLKLVTGFQSSDSNSQV